MLTSGLVKLHVEDVPFTQTLALATGESKLTTCSAWVNRFTKLVQTSRLLPTAKLWTWNTPGGPLVVTLATYGGNIAEHAQ
eukprot:1807854-Amphidinium_carterae.1